MIKPSIQDTLNFLFRIVQPSSRKTTWNQKIQYQKKLDSLTWNYMSSSDVLPEHTWLLRKRRAPKLGKRLDEAFQNRIHNRPPSTIAIPLLLSGLYIWIHVMYKWWFVRWQISGATTLLKSIFPCYYHHSYLHAESTACKFMVLWTPRYQTFCILAM